jgi:hypothetical protein
MKSRKLVAKTDAWIWDKKRKSLLCKACFRGRCEYHNDDLSITGRRMCDCNCWRTARANDPEFIRWDMYLCRHFNLPYSGARLVAVSREDVEAQLELDNQYHGEW